MNISDFNRKIFFRKESYGVTLVNYWPQKEHYCVKGKLNLFCKNCVKTFYFETKLKKNDPQNEAEIRVVISTR